MDFRYRIYNADGEEVEQCGNGARCFARFVREKKLTGKRVISVETASGIIELRVLANHEVEVQMAVPEFEPGNIPFNAPARADSYVLQIAGHAREIGAVSMGNPHALLRVDSTAEADVAGLGPAIESHPRFPPASERWLYGSGVERVYSTACLRARRGRDSRLWQRCLCGRSLWYIKGLAQRIRDS